MTAEKVKNFDGALYGVEEGIKRILLFIKDTDKENIEEIRLRSGKGLSVTKCGESFFVDSNSNLKKDAQSAVRVSKEQVEETYKNLISHSVFYHINELKYGYVMLKGGCRAGIAGSFNEQGAINHISSVNIRIAKEIIGVGDRLFGEYKQGGVLICGKAGSGKTTLLRDFIRLLSNSGKRVSLIDTRGEISASENGQCHNDIGENTDVLLGCEKAFGIECALRTLNPNIIAFDEIGSVEEVKKVVDCLYGGADIVTTAHLADFSLIKRRKITDLLLKTGAISYVVIMGEKVLEKYEIKGIKEVEKGVDIKGFGQHYGDFLQWDNWA